MNPTLTRQDTPDPRSNRQVLGVVLVVDDDVALGRIVARMLGQHGYATKVVTTATEALELIERERFDVLLSDIHMPEMTGVQLLRRVRARNALVPVILMTGDPKVDTAAEAIEYGVFRYLTKPVAQADLGHAVDKAVRLHRMARLTQEAREMTGGEAAGAPDRAELEASFDRALASLWIAYQPIVDARTGKTYGHEALLRSTEASLPHPGAVLDAAARLGRLDDLGRSVRDRASEPVAADPEAGTLFVNLHVRDLLDPMLTSPQSPLTAIASRVVLEITERAKLDEGGDVRARIAELRALGFRIAIDDLGAGYSGLSSLAQLEPEVVKLDMSLVRGIDSSATRQRVVRSMTALSHEMGMLVVAEGVETPAERDTLIGLGCDLLQGYLLAKPARAFPAVSW
ncbi:MAG: EAL domain-containing response regulator [Myxococcales bacterium]|nr:EAL domain-containing response regulator [Myxococcales bacterium]